MHWNGFLKGWDWLQQINKHSELSCRGVVIPALNIQCPCAQVILKGAALHILLNHRSAAGPGVVRLIMLLIKAKALSHPYLNEPYCHYYECIATSTSIIYYRNYNIMIWQEHPHMATYKQLHGAMKCGLIPLLSVLLLLRISKFQVI